MNNRNDSPAADGAGPSFAVSDFDRILIRSVVARAFRDASLVQALDFIDEGESDARQTLTMDITAAHANGSAIDLAKLVDSDDVTFGHDITGIQRHIDRRTGKLRKAFQPRTAMSDAQRLERRAAIERKEQTMKDLLSASHSAGRAEFALEVARRDEEAKAAAAERRRKDENRRRRLARAGKPKAGSKSSHSPRRAGAKRPGRR